MTDKEKIREEVARIQAYTQSDVLKEILDYIDKVQEEPKFKTGDHIKPIDSSLGAPRTILKVCDGWYVTNQGTLDFEFEDNWELAEEPVSEEWIEELRTKLDSLSKEDFKKVFDKYAVDFNEEPVSDDLDIAIGEYCSNPDNFITYIDVAFAYRSEQKDDIPLIIKAIKFGANWQKEQMMTKAVDAKITLLDGISYVSKDVLSQFKQGDKVKVIVIKED